MSFPRASMSDVNCRNKSQCRDPALSMMQQGPPVRHRPPPTPRQNSSAHERPYDSSRSAQIHSGRDRAGRGARRHWPTLREARGIRGSRAGPPDRRTPRRWCQRSASSAASSSITSASPALDERSTPGIRPPVPDARTVNRSRAAASGGVQSAAHGILEDCCDGAARCRGPLLDFAIERIIDPDGRAHARHLSITGSHQDATAGQRNSPVMSTAPSDAVVAGVAALAVELQGAVPGVGRHAGPPPPSRRPGSASLPCTI